MAKNEKRQKEMAAKRAAKKSTMEAPGYQSNYSKKKAYLAVNGGFGNDYREPKPWKS